MFSCKKDIHTHLLLAIYFNILYRFFNPHSEYTWKGSAYCDGSYINTYSTLSEAQNACSHDNNCGCVYQYQCTGSEFWTANGTKTMSSFAGSCAWIDIIGMLSWPCVTKNI